MIILMAICLCIVIAFCRGSSQGITHRPCLSWIGI
uniref:Uncharacterized protein n=1 Tax=Arundo donax TaxID=35708 RepID=A0A0A9F5Q6_ARUDO